MSDTTIIPTTNQQIAKDQGKFGYGSIGAGILSGFLSTYIMNQLSLHGVNFELIGVKSELVKSTVDGTLVGFFVWITPDHFVAFLSDVIIWFRQSCASLQDAWNGKK